jgi:hypothetical protein
MSAIDASANRGWQWAAEREVARKKPIEAGKKDPKKNDVA